MAKRPTPLASALARAMAGLGLTVTDLAREIDVDPEALRAVTDGRTARPGRAMRDALDAYLAPLSKGTTLAICNGEVEDYPHEALRDLLELGQRLSPDALEHLTRFLRALDL